MRPFYFELEFIIVASETLANADPATLPDDLQRFFRRAQGTAWIVDDAEGGTGRWVMGRAHFHIEQYIEQYPSRRDFERDPENPVNVWVKDLFTKYWQPGQNDGLGLRPAAAFWCDDGMQYGTQLHGMVGPDVDTSQYPPVFPYDKRIRDWIPDYVKERDEDGNPIVTQNIPWDDPSFTFTGQFYATRSSKPDFKRRWFQETENKWLDAGAWGTQAWKPTGSSENGNGR